MGKKNKYAGCNNPIAMARASGPAPVSGPTIRDYLSRDRPTLEEATDKIQSAQKKKESGALAAWEEEQNDRYKEELKKHREQRLGRGGALASSSDRKKKKKRKTKRSRHRDRSRSRSHSPPSSDSDSEYESSYRKRRKKSKKRKHSKRRRRHYTSESESESEVEDHRATDEVPAVTDSDRREHEKQSSSTLTGD